MIHDWTDDMIRFMADASMYTDYFVKLADFLEPYIKGCKTICDAGCGLGQLSEELGKRGYTVYACDKSEKVIDYVKSKNYKNVIPIHCDLDSWELSIKFDAMIFNYFGSMEQIIKISKRCCSGLSLTLKKNYRFHRFSFSDKPIHGHTSETAKEYLEKQNIKFIQREFTSELGQPFKTLDDAFLFFSLYSKDDDESLICKENIERILFKSNKEGFAYYLPKEKSSLLFITGEKLNDYSL